MNSEKSGYCRIVRHQEYCVWQYAKVANSMNYVALNIHFDTMQTAIKPWVKMTIDEQKHEKIG